MEEAIVSLFQGRFASSWAFYRPLLFSFKKVVYQEASEIYFGLMGGPHSSDSLNHLLLHYNPLRSLSLRSLFSRTLSMELSVLNRCLHLFS